MNLDPAKFDLSKELGEFGLDHLTLRIDDFLDEVPSEPDSRLLFIRKFCSSVRGSVVVLIPSSNSVGIGLGILGQYLAMITVPANTESFPNTGKYAWGHVLAVADKKLIRCSWEDGLRQWADAATKTTHDNAKREDEGS